jgi:hypothetical protein
MSSPGAVTCGSERIEGNSSNGPMRWILGWTTVLHWASWHVHLCC